MAHRGISIDSETFQRLVDQGLIASDTGVNAQAFVQDEPVSGNKEKKKLKLPSSKSDNSKSFLEASMLFQITMAGLPIPQQNKYARIKGWTSKKGGNYEADFLWREFKLIVEIDGGIFLNQKNSKRVGGHTMPQTFIRDSHKHCTAVTLGFTYLRIASPFVRTGEALIWIEKGLELNGWKREG